MCGRSAYWTSVLFLCLCLVVLTSGCLFGGDDETTTTTRAANNTSATSEKPLGTSDDLPEAFTQAFQMRPLVILFHVPGNADDAAVLDTINRLRTSFGRYVFLTYDYKAPDAYGGLAQLLNVKSVPFVALIDGAGVLQKTFSGFVDEGTLNQALVNLGQD